MSVGDWTALLTEIGIIDQLVEARLSRLLPDGLSPAQYGVLNHFARLGPGHESAPAELAASFQVSRATMTGILSRLADKGLVSVTQDPRDGRRRVVRLTERGLAAREEALSLAGPDLARIADAFPERFARDLVGPLQTLRIWLDEDRK